MNLAGVIGKHGRYRPDHTAVVFERYRLTYREFDRRTNRAANAFGELGIRKGDKVATFLANSLDLLEIYWAAAKIGAVVVPLRPLPPRPRPSPPLNPPLAPLPLPQPAPPPLLPPP